MLYRIFTLSILLTLIAAVAIGAPVVEEKKLTDGDITVTYLTGMEAAAKRVMQIAKQSIKPSLDLHKKSVDLLSNPNATAKDIVTLLGADEKLDEIQNRLKGYKDRSDAFIKCFSNIRLIKKTSAAGAGGVNAGILKVEYAKDKDEFKMLLEPDVTNPDKLQKSFYPIIVNPDNSIRAENKIAETALQFLGSGDAAVFSVVIAPVQETVAYLVAERLKFYHPYGRWFNDGVSGWAARSVVTKADPKLGSAMNKFIEVSSYSKGLKDKVNLIAWPQTAFQNRSGSGFDPALDAAQNQYSVELITNLLGKDGSTLLPKIMGDLNYRGNPDTETICKSIDKFTGKNSMSELLAYVPREVREGIESGEAKTLGAEAEQSAVKKDFAAVADRLRKALEMTPSDVNLRLNYACAERETGRKRDSEFDVFIVAALLKQGKQPFHLFTDTLESRYVLARLAVLVGNLEQAKMFLGPLAEQKPNDEDVKRLLNEIDKIQKAAKGQ